MSIEVERTDSQNGYTFNVTVTEGGGETSHTVTVSEEDYQRLTGGKANPEALVEESFHFLLEREPRESIMRSFDLTVISRYFPKYPDEIGKRL